MRGHCSLPQLPQGSCNGIAGRPIRRSVLLEQQSIDDGVRAAIDSLDRLLFALTISEDAHGQALHDRRPVHRGGLIHHSDRDVQGRFNRSSQHLIAGGAYGHRKTEIRTLNTAQIVLARSSIGEDRCATSKPWSSPRWNGSTGSTTTAFWNPSEIFLQPRPQNDITPCATHQHWPRNLD